MKKIWKILGPGFIVAASDNDAGAVVTYISAGYFLPHTIFWILLLLLPVTYFCQESTAKLAIVTQKGPIELIQHKFGSFWAKIAVYNSKIINFLTLITEFAAINQIFTILHLNKAIFMPIAILIVCLIASPFNYNKWEKIMLLLCGVTITWLLVFFAKFEQGSVNAEPLKQSFVLFLIMSLIGTTVAPWQLYFQHSCILDKKLQIKDLKNEKIETFIGSLFTIIVAGCMMFFGSKVKNFNFTDVPSLVLSSNFYPILILSLIIIASIIGTSSVSVTSAWIYSEYNNWSRSLNKKFNEAKNFYLYFYGTIILSGLITLIPNLSLNLIILGIQVIACVFLPFQLIINHILLNDNKIMNNHVNNKLANAISLSLITIISVLSVCLLKLI